MAFPPRHNFHAQGTHFEAHRPHALGLANQKVYGYGPDGHGDKTVDYLNDKLGHVVKDESFHHTQWGSNAPVYEPATPLQAGDMEDLQAPARPSVTPQILAVVGISLVAGILAYVRPDIFADLFKLFIGYEVLSLLVGAVLVLLLLVVFLMGLHKPKVVKRS